MRLGVIRQCLWACAAVIGFSAITHAEVINGYSSSVNDRFVAGTFPANTPPTPNGASFLLNGFDLSGVGWVPAANGSGTKNVTMVSDLHYIGAFHFQLGVGTTVAFRANDGSYVTRQVASETQIAGSDVMVGQLNLPVPSNVTPIPLAVGPRANFLGQSIYMYGQHAQVGRNILADWLFPNGPNTTENVGTGVTNMIQTDYDPNYNLDGLGILPSEYFSTPGDSGSPDLMVVSGQLTLMGDHMSAYTDGSSVPAGTGETWLASYQPQIAAQLALSGRTLQTVLVPEPSSLLLLGTVCGLPIWRRIRRNRAA